MKRSAPALMTIALVLSLLPVSSLMSWPPLPGGEEPHPAVSLALRAPTAEAQSLATAHVESAQGVRPDICNGTRDGVFCRGQYYTDVNFQQVFDAPPDVAVTVNHSSDDAGPNSCIGFSMDRTTCSPTNITRTGFRLWCSGSPHGGYCGAKDGLYAHATANWLATESAPNASYRTDSAHGLRPLNCDGTLLNSLCNGNFYTDVRFGESFASAPNVLVALEDASTGPSCTGGATDHLRCHPGNITKDGFRLFCGGSPVGDGCGAGTNGLVSQATAGWLAVESTSSCKSQSEHLLETNKCTGSLSNTGTCKGSFYRDVTFPTVFATVPSVIVSPEYVTSNPSCAGGSTDAVRCEATNVTRAGFRAICWGSPSYGECGNANEGDTTRAKFGYVAMESQCAASPTVPQCRDGRDNDGDGRTDFPNDPGCQNPEDDDEADTTPACQPAIEGIVNTRYNTAAHNTHSQPVRVNFPAGFSCRNPSIVTQSKRDSIKCGNNASTAQAVCNNDRGTTSTDLHSYVTDIDASGFSLFVSAESVVFPEGDYPVYYQVFCGDNDVPVCADQRLVAGVSNVQYFNGQAHSTFATVNLPASCDLSSVVTQTYVDGVLCGNGSGPATCINDPGTTSTDFQSFVTNVTSSSFQTFLSTNDGVWVGAVSPQFPIGWHAMCRNSAGTQKTAFGGVTTTGYFNGQANSVTRRVNFPITCNNPSVTTQSYTDSVLCGNGSGPTNCNNDPGTTSTDIYSHIASLSPAGMDVFLSTNDGVWVGATSPQFKIAYHVVCDNQPTPIPQCRDGIDNDGDGRIDFPNDSGCQNPDDDDETDPFVPQCSNGRDDDNDGKIDAQDPGCHSDGNANNPNSYVPQDNDEFNMPTIPQCSDGQDNDGDGKVDYFDPGCYPNGIFDSVSYDPNDNDERDNPSTIFGCIDVIKETFDTQGNPFNPVPQFMFRLDGQSPTLNDGTGRVRFNNVTAGVHTVSEQLPTGWTLLSVTPANGQVTVQAGPNCAAVVFKNKQVVNGTQQNPNPNPNPNPGNCQNTTGNFEGEICTNSSAPNQQSRFSDIDNTSTAGRAANYLAGRNIIGGYSDGTFRAGNVVNRAEAAKFLLLSTFGSVPEKSNNGRFWDVLDGQWYTKFVVDAADRGIIQGFPDGSFRPGQGITRAEFLKMLTLTFGLEQNLSHTFSDVNANDWFGPYVGAAVRYDLFPGIGNQLNPSAPLTRGEIATAIYQILQRLGL